MLLTLAKRLPEEDAYDVCLGFYALEDSLPSNDGVPNLIRAWGMAASRSETAASAMADVVIDHIVNYGMPVMMRADLGPLMQQARKAYASDDDFAKVIDSKVALIPKTNALRCKRSFARSFLPPRRTPLPFMPSVLETSSPTPRRKPTSWLRFVRRMTASVCASG